MGTYYREAQPASFSMSVVYSELTKKSGVNFSLIATPTELQCTRFEFDLLPVSDAVTS